MANYAAAEAVEPAPRFMVLGPLVVRSATGEDLPMGPPRCRQVLATLLLLDAQQAGLDLALPGAPCTSDWLAQAIWGDEQPADPSGALRTTVYGLRRRLGTWHERLAPRLAEATATRSTRRQARSTSRCSTAWRTRGVRPGIKMSTAAPGTCSTRPFGCGEARPWTISPLPGPGRRPRHLGPRTPRRRGSADARPAAPGRVSRSGRRAHPAEGQRSASGAYICAVDARLAPGWPSR